MKSRTDVARPFLKWAGGKTQLLASYDSLLPPLRDAMTYHEPFVGSGALFFHLRAAREFTGRAVLTDVNPALVTAWACVRDQPMALADRLAELADVHSEAEYYRQRDRFNGGEGELGDVERAALVIYLNKKGFNGLYRVNRDGKFNVPIGKSSSGSSEGARLPSADDLRLCSSALVGTDVLCAPFEMVLDRARSGDFVYFDPPYVPVSKTAFFTDYASTGFGPADQEMLRDVFAQLDHRGCFVMLSNSGNLEVQGLYRGFHVTSLLARRAINSKTTSRGPVTELLIRNYE